MSDWTFALLTNPDVLRVNGASTNNHEARHDGDLRVWTATVAAPTVGSAAGDAGAAYYAAAFNTGSAAMKATALAARDFGLPPHVAVCKSVLEVCFCYFMSR